MPLTNYTLWTDGLILLCRQKLLSKWWLAFNIQQRMDNYPLPHCKPRPHLAFFFLWRCDPTRVMASSFLRFLDHTQRHTTAGRTPLDEWSTHCRDLYLTTHNKHPCPWWDLNPRSQQVKGCRPTHLNSGADLNCTVIGHKPNATKDIFTPLTKQWYWWHFFCIKHCTVTTISIENKHHLW